MSWIYNQSNGVLSHTGFLIGTGYSGKGVGRNNPTMEDVPEVGPIPTGVYTIGEPFTHPHAGPICMRLEPNEGDDMHGRSGFMLHGDNTSHTASEGCIIMPRDVREKIAASSDKELVVV